jgi:hypothetical protein
MKVARSSETSENMYQATRRRVAEDNNIHSYRCEIPKSNNSVLTLTFIRVTLIRYTGNYLYMLNHGG